MSRLEKGAFLRLGISTLRRGGGVPVFPGLTVYKLHSLAWCRRYIRYATGPIMGKMTMTSPSSTFRSREIWDRAIRISTLMVKTMDAMTRRLIITSYPVGGSGFMDAYGVVCCMVLRSMPHFIYGRLCTLFEP